jgi:hypothetical protein
VRQLLTVKAERIELTAAPNDAFISARTSRAENPEALQGVHSENVLLIADEASGVPEQVFEAAGGSMSGHNATTLLLGNPTRTSGYFFECFHRDINNWLTFQVSSLTSSRVSADYIQSMKDKYGEDSNAYRVRVLGEFPRTDEDTMIAFELVQTAMDRDITPAPGAPTTWGVDVARFGSDRSALAKRHGQVISEVRTWRNLDLMQLTGAIKAEWDGTPPSQRPQDIFVDVIGLGAGVVDRLRELKLPAQGINVSETPSMGASYANLRAELWGKTKGWLETRGCKLPKDEELLAELTSVRYTFTSSGKLQLEAKSDMKKRGLASPDLADAIVLTMAADAAIGVYGMTSSSDWNKPLKRGLKGVA